jgi:hypothetical protein
VSKTSCEKNRPPADLKPCSATERDSSARFFGLNFLHGCTLYGPQVARLKGFSFFSFSHSYKNISMNPCCRLLWENKIIAGAYWAYCHSLL